jgi:hypothetical protein
MLNVPPVLGMLYESLILIREFIGKILMICLLVIVTPIIEMQIPPPWVSNASVCDVMASIEIFLSVASVFSISMVIESCGESHFFVLMRCLWS